MVTRTGKNAEMYALWLKLYISLFTAAVPGKKKCITQNNEVKTDKFCTFNIN